MGFDPGCGSLILMKAAHVLSDVSARSTAPDSRLPVQHIS